MTRAQLQATYMKYEDVFGRNEGLGPFCGFDVQ